MRYLATALAISFGMGMVLFGIVYPMFHDAHLAAGIAAIPIAGCHHIAEMLERREARRSVTAHHVGEIHTLQGFVVAWPRLVSQTTVTFVGISLAAMVFGMALMPLILGLDGVAAVTRAQGIGFALAMLPIEMMGAVYVGRWIGSRSAKPSAASALLVLALGWLIVTGLLRTIDSDPLWFSIEDISVVPIAIAGLLGYRHGR